MGQAHALDNKLTQEQKLMKIERTYLFKECYFEEMLECVPWVETRIILHKSKIRLYQQDTLTKKIKVDSSFVIISEDFADRTVSFSYKVEETQYRAMIQMDSPHKMLNLKVIIMRSKRPAWERGSACQICGIEFTLIRRKHHCRNCGKLVCNYCSPSEMLLKHLGYEGKQRVCVNCRNPGFSDSPFRSGRVNTEQIEADSDLNHTPTFNTPPELNFTFANS